MVATLRYLSQEHKNIIDPVLHRNSYFAQPENIILAMMTDHRPHIRELRLRRLMKARAAKASGKIQKFKVPANLFDPVEYFKLINWTDLPIKQQPVLKIMTDAELQQFIVMDVTPIIFFQNFPDTRRPLKGS